MSKIKEKLSKEEIEKRRNLIFDKIASEKNYQRWENVIKLCDDYLKSNKDDFFILGYKGEALLKLNKETEGKEILIFVTDHNRSIDSNDMFGKARSFQILGSKEKKQFFLFTNFTKIIKKPSKCIQQLHYKKMFLQCTI